MENKTREEIKRFLDEVNLELWSFLGEINNLPLPLQLAKMVNKIQEILIENIRLKMDLEDLKESLKQAGKTK